MRKRGFIAASVTAVLLTGLALVATAQSGQQDPARPGMQRGRGPGGFGPMGPGPMGGPAGFGLPLRQLDLTDAQKDQVKAITESHRDEVRQLGDRTREAHRALQLAIESGNESDIRAKSTALGTVIGDDGVLRARVNAEILNVLTPEQQEKLKTLRAEREQQIQERIKQRRPDRRSRPQ